LSLLWNDWDACVALQEHYETAIYHFQQLLERNPNHYGALSQLVSLLRRAGRLEDIPKFLKNATKSTPRAAMDPGLHYCKGLQARCVFFHVIP
jgi:tetratricopeptide repeat protein 21B